MDIETALKKGQLILKDNKIKSAELDSEILMFAGNSCISFCQLIHLGLDT